MPGVDVLASVFNGANAAFIDTSTIRSMPPAPITTGTPTYRSFTPYSPFSSAAHGSTRFLSFR